MRGTPLVVLLGLLACCGPSEAAFVPPADWLEPQPITPVIEEAIARATACAALEGLPLVRPATSLHFHRILAMTFDLDGRRSDFSDLPWSGYAWAGNVAVVKPRADLVALWAHELLHQMFGVGDGAHRAHPPLFYRCNLYPI